MFTGYAYCSFILMFSTPYPVQGYMHSGEVSVDVTTGITN